MTQVFKTRDNNGRIVLPEDIKAFVYKVGNGNDVLNFFFVHNGQRYYFKANSVYSLDTTEIFSQALASKVGVESVKMQPAVYQHDGQKYYGVISKDFVNNRAKTEVLNAKAMFGMFNKKPNQQTSNMSEKGYPQKQTERYNTLEHHIECLKLLKSYNNFSDSQFTLELDPEIPKQLKHQLLFSYLIANQDCFAHNIEYLVTETEPNKKTVFLAPLFDNSISFLVKSFKKDWVSHFKSLTEHEKVHQVDKILDSINFPFQVKQSSRQTLNRALVTREVAQLINSDEQLKNFYQNFKKVNVKQLFTNLKQENNFNFISDHEIELASLVVKRAVHALDTALEYEKFASRGPMRLLQQANKQELALDF